MFLHQVFNYSALHSTPAELLGEISRPLFGHTRKFAKVEVSVIEMLNQTRRNAVETNEAQPTHHPFGPEVLGEKFLVTQPVLQGKQDGVSMQQRRINSSMASLFVALSAIKTNSHGPIAAEVW